MSAEGADRVALVVLRGFAARGGGFVTRTPMGSVEVSASVRLVPQKVHRREAAPGGGGGGLRHLRTHSWGSRMGRGFQQPQAKSYVPDVGRGGGKL